MELHSFKKILDSKMDASGEKFGKLTDLYFEDTSFVIRYAVVDTGSWFRSHKVLISPAFVKRFGWESDTVPVNLKPEQIRNAPSWNSEKPISRQYERVYFEHYQYNPYWAGAGIWGGAYYPEEMRKVAFEQPPARLDKEPGDPHLRSSDEILGYKIDGVQGEEGRFGHVEDFIFDRDTWSIRYFVIDTLNYLPSKSVLISPDWVESFNWDDKTMSVIMSKEKIKSAPKYDASRPPSRAYESELYAHYGKRFYWESLPDRKDTSAA